MLDPISKYPVNNTKSRDTGRKIQTRRMQERGLVLALNCPDPQSQSTAKLLFSNILSINILDRGLYLKI
jgi:hypothetical protein